MPTPADLVYQTTTDVGTGNLVLSSVNGKRTFAEAFGTGATLDVFDYYISNNGVTGSSNAEFEIGTGHMSDANTFVRDTVSRSTNSATFNATISGTTLTVVGAVTSGTIAAGQFLYWTGQTGAPPKIVSGSNPTWTISSTQTLATSTPITAYGPVSLTTGIKDITNDVPAALQVRTSTNTVTDGHGVVFNGTSGNLIKSLGAAPQPSNATLTSLGGLSLASGDTLYATAASTLAKLAAGSNTNVLKLVGGLPSWGLPFTVRLTAYTSGTNTYTPPTGLVGAIIICTGGGGGSAGATMLNSTVIKASSGGGGGGGSTSISFLTGAQIGTAAITVVVGAGGTAGSASTTTSPTAGGNGSDTTFGGTLVVGKGGSGAGSYTVTAATAGQYVGSGGAGGVAGTGTITFAGQAGTNRFGHSFTTTPTGNVHFYYSGCGGSTFWGEGGRPAFSPYASSVAGNAGTGYGTGAGGACIYSNAGTPTQNGIAGTGGICAIFELYGA